MPEPKQFYGRYHRVNTQIWTDPAFAGLPPVLPSARYLYFWLLAGQEATNLPGVVIAGPMAVAEILDWEVPETKAAFQSLVDAGLVLMDAKARLIYVLRSLADNPPANPNVITSWETSWSEIAPCPLKDIIWAKFEAHAKARGEEFLKNFNAACPRGNGSGNGSSNGSGNGSLDGSGNDTRNKNQHQSLPQSLEQNPEQNNALGSGEVLSGFTSGDGDRGTTDLGQEPGADCGPGCGPGCSPSPDPQAAPQPIAATGAGEVHDYGPRDERTLDDIDDDQPAPAPAPTTETPAKPVVEVVQIPAAAQYILDDWNTRVATPGSVFEAVTGRDAEILAPDIMEALKDVDAVTDFNDLFQIIPKDGFYSGDNDTKFVAFLRHYVKMTPEKRHKCADIARNKIRRLKGKAKSRSEIEAREARERAKAGAVPPQAKSEPESHSYLDTLIRS